MTLLHYKLFSDLLPYSRQPGWYQFSIMTILDQSSCFVRPLDSWVSLWSVTNLRCLPYLVKSIVTRLKVHPGSSDKFRTPSRYGSTYGLRRVVWRTEMQPPIEGPFISENAKIKKTCQLYSRLSKRCLSYLPAAPSASCQIESTKVLRQLYANLAHTTTGHLKVTPV